MRKHICIYPYMYIPVYVCTLICICSNTKYVVVFFHERVTEYFCNNSLANMKRLDKKKRTERP